jgi:hypothetical protein
LIVPTRLMLRLRNGSQARTCCLSESRPLTGMKWKASPPRCGRWRPRCARWACAGRPRRRHAQHPRGRALPRRVRRGGPAAAGFRLAAWPCLQRPTEGAVLRRRLSLWKQGLHGGLARSSSIGVSST